jgi:hypothetical protein
MLMIATAIPAVGTLNKTINEKNVQTQSKGTYDLVIIAPSIFSPAIFSDAEMWQQCGHSHILSLQKSIYSSFPPTYF